MLLVIFGAGASYDSVPHLFPPQKPMPWEDDRPPLANELFENRREFVAAMERFRDCMALVPLLRKPGIVVERELAKFQEQAKTYPKRHQQLAAIRYYLHFALWDCQRRWRERHRGITNYATFLDEVERWRYSASGRVCFVTFNYDTMLEEAISQVLRLEITNLNAYISQPTYSLIKLHGSVNWGRDIDGLAAPHTYNQQRLIDEAASLKISNDYRLVTQYPMLREGDRLVFPALAIPVERKDEFSCPQSHIKTLEEALPEVTKIVAIGWRATEAEFLNMLKLRLKLKPELMVVSGDKSGATETFSHLSPFVANRSRRAVIENGFTNLIGQLDELGAFLRQ